MRRECSVTVAVGEIGPGAATRDPRTARLQRRRPRGAAIDRLDLHALATGADDGLDELAVRVLVAAIDELRERVHPVGSLIVHAGEIERTQRIVRWTNHEESREPAGEVLEDVA